MTKMNEWNCKDHHYWKTISKRWLNERRDKGKNRRSHTGNRRSFKRPGRTEKYKREIEGIEGNDKQKRISKSEFNESYLLYERSFRRYKHPLSHENGYNEHNFKTREDKRRDKITNKEIARGSIGVMRSPVVR